MSNGKIRIILDSGGKTVILPIIKEKRGSLISFLKHVYLKDLGLSNKKLNAYLDDANNIILARK